MDSQFFKIVQLCNLFAILSIAAEQQVNFERRAMNVTTAARFSAQNQSAEAITPTLVVLRTVVLPLILTVVCVIGLCGNGAVLYIMLMKVISACCTLPKRLLAALP